MIQPDLLAPLEPEPTGEPETLVGTLRGDLDLLDAAAAQVEVWCGPKLGWLPMARRVGSVACVVRAYGRDMAGPTYLLGDEA
jgi:hypothetical protein